MQSICLNIESIQEDLCKIRRIQSFNVEKTIMENMMRVLVAEADLETQEMLTSTLTRFGFAVYEASDGMQALSMIGALSPNIVVLSLALPLRDGLGILESLSKYQLSAYPHMVVVTAMGKEARVRALQLGADIALAKPVDPSVFAMQLRDMGSNGPSVLGIRHAKKRADFVNTQLKEIGMQEGLKGFAYLARAVALVSVDYSMLRRATGNLYPRIAVENNVTDHSVERAIRHAIETTWTRASMETLHRVFGNSIDPQRGKPTNTECIAMLVEQLWERMSLEANVV